jgi:NADH-quinone oxidoreductase subunit G
LGIVCAINGISTVQKLFQVDKEWYKRYIMVEVMACNGGCLNGGGEPKYIDPSILEQRMKGIYTIDETSHIRKSHENPDIKKLYQLYFEKPLSRIAKQFLHTNYYARNSARQKLALFLDAIDRRDAQEAMDLFEEDGIWDTGSPFGIIEKNSIPDFIKQLPIQTETYPKHGIVGSTGLNVIDTLGTKSRFEIEFGPQGKIQKIQRIPELL